MATAPSSGRTIALRNTAVSIGSRTKLNMLPAAHGREECDFIAVADRGIHARKFGIDGTQDGVPARFQLRAASRKVPEDRAGVRIQTRLELGLASSGDVGQRGKKKNPDTH